MILNFLYFFASRYKWSTFLHWLNSTRILVPRWKGYVWRPEFELGRRTDTDTEMTDPTPICLLLNIQDRNKCGPAEERDFSFLKTVLSIVVDYNSPKQCTKGRLIISLLLILNLQPTPSISVRTSGYWSPTSELTLLTCFTFDILGYFQIDWLHV